MKPTKPQNYRGLRDALLIQVLEGNGSPEFPFENVEYVITQQERDREWGFVTIGKVLPLTEEEREWFN